MSRIGFLPIDVRGLDCSFDASSNSILFSTAAFKKSYQLPKSIECSFDGSSIRLSLSSSAFSSCVVGLHRSLLNSCLLYTSDAADD